MVMLMAEENKRMKIFSENLEKAHFYQVHDLGTAVYGATPLSDLTGLRPV